MFAFAGLWETWKDRATGKGFETRIAQVRSRVRDGLVI